MVELTGNSIALYIFRQRRNSSPDQTQACGQVAAWVPLCDFQLGLGWLPSEKCSGQGGSVKIKSQGWKIKWTSRGSFSAVSTPIFASKYSLESFWRDLQDLHAFAPLRPQYFSKISSIFFGVFKIRHAENLKFDFFKFRRDFRWFSWHLLGFSQIFSKNAATTRNFSISIWFQHDYTGESFNFGFNFIQCNFLSLIFT